MNIPQRTLDRLKEFAADGDSCATAVLHIFERLEKLEQWLTRGDFVQVPPTPKAAPVATENGLLRCYGQAIEDAVKRGASHDEAKEAGRRAIYDLGLKHGAAQPAPPVAPVSDSKMSAYNHRAAARFAILDRLEKVIDFNSYGWQLTSEGEQWQQLVAEQNQDECEMEL